MSFQFWPCPRCSRHVKRGDAICPFCSASVEMGPTRTIAGRLSRAALFAAGAMGAAVATTDCASSSPVFTPPYGGFPAPIEDSSASNVPAEAAPDAGDASAATGPTDSSSALDVPMMAASYGSIFSPDE